MKVRRVDHVVSGAAVEPCGAEQPDLTYQVADRLQLQGVGTVAQVHRHGSAKISGVPLLRDRYAVGD